MSQDKNSMIRYTLNSHPKVELIKIPVDGLFLYRSKVWRSMGKLLPESYSVTAQRVVLNQYGTEVALENADFTEHLLVEPYNGELPKIDGSGPYNSASDYQRRKIQNS